MECLAERLKKIPKWSAVCFAFALLAGVLTHMYMLTNKLPNYDDLSFFNGVGYTLESGRWFLEALGRIGLGGRWSVPWTAGVMAFACIGGAACLLLSSLRQKDLLSAALVPILLVTFPSTASILSFMFFADLYFFGVLLTCLGVYCIRRFRWGFLFGGAIVGLAMGIYQAYVCLAAGVLLLGLIKDTLAADAERKAVLVGALRAFAALLLAVGLYYVVLKIALFATGTALQPYQGLDGMGKISIAAIPGQCFDAYRGIFRYFLTKSPSVGLPTLAFLNGALCLCMGGMLCAALSAKRNRVAWKIAFTLLFTGLLPLALAGVYVMAPGANVHMVVSYQYVLFYVAALVFADAFLSARPGVRAARRFALPAVTAVLLLFVAAENLVVVNHAYMASQLAFDKAYAYFERMALRIEESGEFAYGDTLAVVGPCRTDVFGAEPMSDELKNMTGFDNAANVLDYPAGARHAFLTHYVGLNAAYDDYYEWCWREIPEIVAMPAYPAAGSIRRVGDAVIVKMGD